MTEQIIETFRRTRRQFWLPVTATLTTDGVGVLGNGQTVQIVSELFHVTSIYATAIDNEGVRLTPNATFDQITVEIVDANSKYSYTNGAVDLMSLADMGRNFNWLGWCFYPRQQLNFTFTWNVVGAGISADPIIAELTLAGNRYLPADYPGLSDAVQRVVNGG